MNIVRQECSIEKVLLNFLYLRLFFEIELLKRGYGNRLFRRERERAQVIKDKNKIKTRSNSDRIEEERPEKEKKKEYNLFLY